MRAAYRQFKTRYQKMISFKSSDLHDTRGQSCDKGQNNSPSILSCRAVWKLYGHNVAKVTKRRSDHITDALLREFEVIGAVRDVNLEIKLGEVFVIMGLSGSGKSTLVRCMTGLVEPTLGSLLVEGTDLVKISRPALVNIRRKSMGMVFQDFALLPHLTVLGNIAFPLKVQGVTRPKREARALELIELVGLEDRKDHYPHELSGGQQQRVGIARSLTTQPQIWFLDEPFSALDPLIRREMQDELLKLQRLLQKTIVFITHDFDEAIYLADRIAIMHDGRVIQVGTPEHLIVKPANDYVAKFTKNVSRLKVLSVGSVMKPSLAGPFSDAVDTRTMVRDVVERILSSESPLGVVSPRGEVIGAIDRNAVIQVLLNRDLGE
jgi:glycine betaine/proline transport system ATP-binding protein